MRFGHKANDAPTFKKILENRKKEMTDYNLKTFGNVAIGIHGKELPKFASTSNLHDYWKLGNQYKDAPQYSSRIELTQTQKYWAKPDKMLIADVKEDPRPQDPFKEMHIPKTVKNDIVEKVNKLNHFKCEPKEIQERMGSAPMHSKWTENVHYFAQTRGAYEEDPNMRASLVRYEELPLPSSFSPNGVFEDPLKKMKAMSKPQTSEAKIGKPSTRIGRTVRKEQYRMPKENLISRVVSKKQFSSVETDMRKTVTLY